MYKSFNKYKFIFLVFGSIAFLYLILQYGLLNLANDIVKTGFWFIPVIIIWLVIYLLNTTNWFVNIKALGEKISFSDLLVTHISSSAINYITPFVSLGGEPYRLLCVADKLGKEKAISSVLLYNLFHVFSHIVFWSLCCIISIVSLKDKMIISLSWIALFFLSVLIALFFVGLNKGFFSGLVRLLEGRLFFGFLNRFLSEKREVILKIDGLISSIHSENKRYFYVAFLSEFFSRIAASVEFYLIIFSIDINIPIFSAVYMYGAASLLLNIMFFIPMESGTREGTLYYITGSIGINSHIGIYISVVTRLRELFWILSGLMLMKFNNPENRNT